MVVVACPAKRTAAGEHWRSAATLGGGRAAWSAHVPKGEGGMGGGGGRSACGRDWRGRSLEKKRKGKGTDPGTGQAERQAGPAGTSRCEDCCAIPVQLQAREPQEIPSPVVFLPNLGIFCVLPYTGLFAFFRTF